MNLEKTSHHHHGQYENRPDLAGEYKYGDLGQLILAVIFLVVWGLDTFLFKFSTFLAEKVDWYFMVIPGVIVLTIAAILARLGLKIIFGEKRDPPVVITKSVFSIVRHPIYLGSIFTYLGLILLSYSIVCFILWIPIIIFYYYISRHEEKLMLSKYGKEYEEYMNRVPMLFPLKFRRS